MRRTKAARTSCSIFVTAQASFTTSSLDRMLAVLQYTGSDGCGLTDCHPNKRLGFREFYIWVKTHLLVVRVWVLRNPTKSVAFPKPPRGDAEVSGRENRPRHSRRYVLPAHQARGVQHRRSPSYGRAKIRSYVNSAFSASPATADALAQKPPATLEETGCPRHICTANRGPKPAIRGRHGLNPKP